MILSPLDSFRTFNILLSVRVFSPRPGSTLPCVSLPGEGRLPHPRIQYFPEIVEIGERHLLSLLILNRLDHPNQVAGLVLLKPVNTNDVGLHTFVTISRRRLQVGYRKKRTIEKIQEASERTETWRLGEGSIDCLIAYVFSFSLLNISSVRGDGPIPKADRNTLRQ